MVQKIRPASVAKIKSMFQSGIEELSFDDAKNLGLEVGTHIPIDTNLILEKQMYFKAYSIRLLDSKKDLDGRWLDEYIDFNKIISALNEFHISKKTLAESKETTINKNLENHLRKFFVNAHMSTGNQRSYFDLVIGDMVYIIEIKLARALKNTGQMQKAIGQIDGYRKELKSNNLILLVVGEKQDRQEKNIHYIMDDIEKKKTCKFYFLEAI